jgi:hypothetical protein
VKRSGKLSAEEWFLAARACYVAQHQGCPYCQEQHCVFRSLWVQRIEYYCSHCDFSACLEVLKGTYLATPGSEHTVRESVLDEAL